jgi:glycosyltransferase involved in cell wall biosynthesis
MSTRILHFAPNAETGGMERLCETFIRHTQSIKHTVVAMGNPGAVDERWRGVGAAVINRQIGNQRWRQYTKIARITNALQPTAVLIWAGSRIGLFAAACHRGGARRIAISVGNPVAFNFSNRLAARAYVSLPGAKCCTIVAQSEHVASSIRRERMLAGYHLRTVYNAVDLEIFRFHPPSADHSSPCVGMVARLDRIKDHACLLAAWEIVKRQVPHATLELAGEGPLKSHLQELAAGLKISASVRFLGRVEDIPSLLKGWRVAIHATTQAEGFGISMVEAMAIGCPLVATDVAAAREVTNGGEVARLVPEGDAESLASEIVRLIKEPRLAECLAVEGRKWIESRFSPPLMVKGYLDALGLG